MTDDVKETMVTLCSQEGQKFEVKKSVIKQSELVLTMIDDDDDADEDQTQEIPLPNVRQEVLKKVIEFCEHHAENEFPDIEKPLKSSNMQEVVGEWDAKYVEVDMEFLFELILAANYMDIKSLLDLTCAKVHGNAFSCLFLIGVSIRSSYFLHLCQVASMIKGKTPEEIRQTFNIVNDFTPEEEKQVREENKWCEEA
jgi:S-phase kinase-associated protein 1